MPRTMYADAGMPATFAFAEDDVAQELVLGEPICPPRTGGRSSLLNAAIVTACLGAGGWALVKLPESWRAGLMTEIAAIVAQRSATSEQVAPQPTVQAAPQTIAGPPPQAAREVAAAPGADAGMAVPPPRPDEAAESIDTPKGRAGEEHDDLTEKPLPPPEIDPANPLQKRALAAGLHPDLSQSLLSRLSKADYRNAGVAIKTALAETPDAGTFVWPRENKGKLALFEVRFVDGAARPCRRYVVTVTLARWSTTAPPMEKCGADGQKRKAARASAG
ncbi:MAG: hypothetical protein ABL907_17810 [Hyphomicrobium sp.]